MALGDIIGKVTGGATLSGFMGGLLQGVTVFFSFLVIAILLGVGGYLYWNSKRYSKKIIIAKKIGGSTMFAGRDTARVVKIGDMGNEILRLKKLKVYRVSKGIQIDKDTYLFVIDTEGNWHNVGLSDISKDLMKLNYEIPSNDARMANVSIRRLNEKQFENSNWAKENIGLIVGGMIIVVIVIFMWLMAAKYFTIFDTQKNILLEYQKSNEQAGKNTEAMTRLVETIDKFVNQGGARFTPVNNTAIGGT